MCGIAGKVYLNRGEVGVTELAEMQEKIMHRGPDDRGTYISPDKKVGLTHTRLAIIDLSPMGHQPMDYLNRYKIVFNGEIYNFREERKQLEKTGYKFKSNSDTEVILALYDMYQEDCLKRLRGMFAFVIYDNREKTIFAARDRVGKKPLKYYFDGNVFIFASELKAILTQKEVTAEPDWKAIHYFLTFGYAPAPYTGFEGINKLEPAHFLKIYLETGELVKTRYWYLDYNHKPELSEKEWMTLIREKLEESVRLRMISDVPVGVLLSGGIDSSAITAYMAKLSSKPINSFTIKFADKEADESSYARKIANLFHTNHTELEAKPEAIEILPDLVYDYAQPFADNSAVVTFMVSRLAKKYVTVALNGDGGDENFAGYDKHLRLARDASFYKFKTPLSRYLSPALNSVAKITETDFIKRAVRYMNNLDTHPLEKYIGYESFFQGYPDQVYKDKFELSNADDYRDKALYSDIAYFLPDDLLLKTDIAGMRSALEYRSPLLDQEMVELAAKIPFDLKVKNRETKYIFKKSMEGILPKSNIYRKKMGFTIPLGKWFTGSLHDYAKGVLLSPKARLKYLINRLEAKDMLTKHSLKNDYGLKLWCLLTLELWFERFF